VEKEAQAANSLFASYRRSQRENELTGTIQLKGEFSKKKKSVDSSNPDQKRSGAETPTEQQVR
jgi:hypothetical protein